MAFINHCGECKKDTLHNGTQCLECKAKIIRYEKEEFLKGRSQLLTGERITALESDIFDLKKMFQDFDNKHKAF